MDIDALYRDLTRCPRELITLFAARCALRVAPIIACQGSEFPFWEDSADEQLFSAFRALNVSFALSNLEIITEAGISAKLLAKDSAFAAGQASLDAEIVDKNFFYEAFEGIDTDEAYNAANDADRAAEAVKSAAYAALSITADTIENAASAAIEACYAASIATAAATSATAIDVEELRSGNLQSWQDLWHGKPPEDNSLNEKTFKAGLCELGLGYWAEEYENWTEGRFDRARLERCLYMPSSTVKAGIKAMLAYLTETQLVRDAEARVVFLGEGRAGKTSLIRSLFDQEVQVDEKATPRIEIRQRTESINGSDVRVHYWDFGGQVIMHATHQFFLREKSVYVIVLDSGRCESLEYWLDHVRVFAAEAPTIIVLNKVDLLPTGIETRPPFDLNKIRRRYPFVVDAVYPLSCSNGDGVELFASALQELIVCSHILKPDMQEKLFLVKEELARENLDFITRDRFDDICRSHKLEADEILTALSVLDALGVAIHFPTLCHKEVVLNPEWITKAIYFIIWSSEKKHLNGRLDSFTLKGLFDEAQAEIDLDIEVPEDKNNFLLDLMTEFKLAFKSSEQNGVYCVPMLTPTEEPSHSVSRYGGLQFVFSLPFLPPGLFYRFIAESGTEIVDNLIWKTGAVLVMGENQVLVEYSDYLRTITFTAHGTNAGLYLTSLRQRLMKILGDSYQELDYEPYIVTPEGDRINWREMTKRFAREGKESKVYTNSTEYYIEELIKAHLGTLGDNLKEMVKKEFELMRIHIMPERNIKIEVNPTFNPTISPRFDQKNEVNVSVTVTNDIKALNNVDSKLVEIERLLKHYKEDEELEIEQEKAVKRLEREIACLREDIAELNVGVEPSPIADAKRAPIMGRIKNGWDAFAEFSKKHYYILGFSEKVHEICGLMKKVDWSVLLR